MPIFILNNEVINAVLVVVARHRVPIFATEHITPNNLMGIYVVDICKKCSELATGPSEPLKCPYCGIEKGGWDRKKLASLVLKHESHPFVVYEERKSFGRDQFRVLGLDIYKYSGAIQFDVIAGDDAWQIEGKTGNPTPTLLNGVDIGGRQENLKVGDKISVGPLKLEVNLRAQ